MKNYSLEAFSDGGELSLIMSINKDLKFVLEIHTRLRNKEAIVYIKDIIKIVEKEPELVKINEQIGFDDGFMRSLMEGKKYM